MTRFKIDYLDLLLLASLAFVPFASGQNLLTNNAGFEANTAYYGPGWGFPDGTPEVLPGWIITLDPAADGYAGAATNQTPQDLEGTHFGYIYTGSSGSSGLLETAPESRAAVAAGGNYTLWFLARGDASWSEAFATISLVWHPNNNNGATVGDPTNLDITLPMRVSTEDPMQTFHISGVAPVGAHYASVRVTRPPWDYAPMIFDDFVIMAEPSEVSLSIKKNNSQAEVSWTRSLHLRLEMTDNPGLSNGWSVVDKPTKGIGAKNRVDYPLTESVRFFRLSPSD